MGLTKIHMEYREEKDKAILQMITTLKAHKELDRINKATIRGLEKVLDTGELGLLDYEGKSYNAELALKIRSEILRSLGVYMITFGDGIGDRLHPNHWGKEINQELLNGIHRCQDNPISTIRMLENNVSNENTISMHQKNLPQPWWKTPPQCTTNFCLNKKFEPQVDESSGIIYFVQRGAEKKMTCVFEPNKTTHSHIKEIWSRKLGERVHYWKKEKRS